MQLIKQPRVLDGDDGLGGESPEKRYLLIVNGLTSVRRIWSVPIATPSRSSGTPAVVRWPSRRAKASFGKFLRRRLEVNYMNRLPIDNGSACNASTRAWETSANFLWDRTPMPGYT